MTFFPQNVYLLMRVCVFVYGVWGKVRAWVSACSPNKDRRTSIGVCVCVYRSTNIQVMICNK